MQPCSSHVKVIVFSAVKQRMRSVTNIQKITKAMKMVAASKMRVAQVSTEKARGLIVPLVKSLGDLPGICTGLFSQQAFADRVSRSIADCCAGCIMLVLPMYTFALQELMWKTT